MERNDSSLFLENSITRTIDTAFKEWTISLIQQLQIELILAVNYNKFIWRGKKTKITEHKWKNFESEFLLKLYFQYQWVKKSVLKLIAKTAMAKCTIKKFNFKTLRRSLWFLQQSHLPLKKKNISA